MRISAPVAYAASAVLHAVAFVGVARVPPTSPAEEVAVEIVEVAPPPSPAPAPPPLAPPPRRPPRRPPVPLPRDAPARTLPRDTAPPPPNAEPPPDAAPPAKAPVRIGVSLGASTSAGGVAAPAGNTLYGELPRTAPDPADVTPYRSGRYVPPTQVTVLPRPIGDCRPPADEYPPAAQRLGIEGLVVLVLTIDEKGAISDARVVEDPGHGLGAAAVATIRRNCRFEPGRVGSEPVATRLKYRVRFELP